MMNLRTAPRKRLVPAYDSRRVPAGEIRDPQRTVPFGLFATLAVVTSIYISIRLFTVEQRPRRPRGAPRRRRQTFSGKRGRVSDFSGRRRVDQLPRVLGAVHERLRTPYVSIIVSAALALAFALSSTFLRLVTISVLVNVVTYAVSCASLPVLRRNDGAPPAAFRSPFGPAVAVMSLSLCAWLFSTSSAPEILTTTAAAAGGALVYAVSRRPQRNPSAVVQPSGL